MRKRFDLGLIGYPVGHSVSAVMHEAALRSHKLRGSYALFEIPEHEVDDYVEEVRRGELDGINVTIPYKQLAAECCDRLAPTAAALGAVNTVLRADDGAVEGHNTDLPGLVDALSFHWPARPWTDRPAAVIGAGGAARAAVCAALEAGAGSVRVFNRTPERVESLVASLGPAYPGQIAMAATQIDAIRDAGLILQATSVGMSAIPQSPAWESAAAVAATGLAHARSDAIVYDLVYRPTRTPWVGAASRYGLEAASGLEMLVRQAAIAFERWVGAVAPVDVMRRAAQLGL